MSTKQITIAGTPFTVATPFVAGHVLTEGEAKALNQTRLENIRNNMAAQVKKEMESIEADAEGNKAVPQSLIDAVSKYDSEYEFTLATVSAGRRSTDPVDTEARKIAKASIAKQIIAKGGKLADVPKDRLAAAVETLSQRADIQKAAKDAVKARNKVAEGGLDNLDDLFAGVPPVGGETSENVEAPDEA